MPEQANVGSCCRLKFLKTIFDKARRAERQQILTQNWVANSDKDVVEKFNFQKLAGSDEIPVRFRPSPPASHYFAHALFASVGNCLSGRWSTRLSVAKVTECSSFYDAQLWESPTLHFRHLGERSLKAYKLTLRQERAVLGRARTPGRMRNTALAYSYFREWAIR
jgi:hypothetical protein